VGTVPAQAGSDPLRHEGAVLTQRDGCEVVAHYGSVAAEIAVCLKAAGLVDLANLRLMSITAPEAQLERVLAAALPDGVPPAGYGVRIADTWCCRVSPERAIVAGAPGAVARWRQVAGGARVHGGSAVAAEPVPGSAAISVLGPRADGVMATAGLPADLPAGGVASGRLAGAPVTVVREDGDHYLLLLEEGCSAAVWQALGDAGRPIGLAPVGIEALERLQAARRPPTPLG
jgi:glycine cleavage system aminomethyltransferase T